MKTLIIILGVLLIVALQGCSTPYPPGDGWELTRTDERKEGAYSYRFDSPYNHGYASLEDTTKKPSGYILTDSTFHPPMKSYTYIRLSESGIFEQCFIVERKNYIHHTHTKNGVDNECHDC